ncbi:MAG TPA: hypothetical protein VJN90_06060 [Candidatus Acidoferrales bacterium]|nr:hypothetical protein [Candidatus Acidoferrales bacterium]
MTSLLRRCPNCGAERPSARPDEVCDYCHLAPAEANRAMRRGLVNRFGIFLLGTVAFFVPCFLYPPLELDGIFIFIGVIFFATIFLAVWVERRALRRQEVELLKRIFHGLVPLPWLLGALLFINGSLDRSPPQNFESHVISRFAMPGLLPMHQLIVTSWRDGGLERLAVTRQDFDLFHNGDAVEVRVQSGLVGIPWIFGVYSK